MGWFNRRKDSTTIAADGSIDIDALTNQASQGDDTAQQSAWKAIFELPAWHFVGDRERPKAPVVIHHAQQGSCVLAFTDAEHAARYARERHLLNEQGETFHIEMRIPNALAYLKQLGERGVKGILFNISPVGLGAVLSDFIPEIERVLQHQIANRFDELVKRAHAQGGGTAFREVWAEAHSLTTWYFVGDKQMPDRPYLNIVNGEPAVFAFTDEIHALRFIKEEGLQLDDGSASLLGYPLPLALETLVRLYKEHHVPRVVFNSNSEYFIGFLKDLPDKS
ncbi:MAG: hypothetical protein D8M52_11190 [Chlorobi bacterium]|nr:MAG: hypothetical protein EDM74_11800 [Armatimonadota bacterium]MBE7455460.1 hypothetical protein [Planctomycetia bacterium]MBL1162251.1 hypothetical protein [Chlorobiota bacterium]NOG68714.1 hypothetical protein [Chlorobiota bacterium]